MKLSCCIITKGDEELPKLAQAVSSVYPYVDGVYITATSDKTEKTEKYCKDMGIHYSHFAWCDDFSKARNFNFSQAPQDSDYILWIDTDDVLQGGEKLKEVAQMAKDNGKDVVLFTYWYGCDFNPDGTIKAIQMEHMRERLLRPGVTTWKGRLHETPVPIEGAQNNYTPYSYEPEERPIVVIHTSKDTELPEKMERNKRILELQLKEEQEAGKPDPRTLLYLIKIYAENDNPEDWEKVMTYGDQYLKTSGWDEERGTCWEQMGIVYGKQNKFLEAIECFHNAINEWPHQVLFYIRLAAAYYNSKNYKKSRHWLEQASNMDMERRYTSGMNNLKAMKVLFADLLLKLNYNVDKDTKKALEAARLLYSEIPSEEHAEQVKFLEDVDALNKACKNFDELAHYLSDIGAEDKIVPLLELLPDGISNQPFAQSIRKRFTPPRRWKDNEICYFANFGGKHFEKWDSSALKSGIGGSETAVIELAKEWTKLGYKVTIYADPHHKGTDEYGITWLPWYYFNKNDYFNIFIQWRGWQLAGKVKARKFYVDLHDIFSTIDITQQDIGNIDKFMVKSKYHRMLAQNIPDEKFCVISNGIRV